MKLRVSSTNDKTIITQNQVALRRHVTNRYRRVPFFAKSGRLPKLMELNYLELRLIADLRLVTHLWIKIEVFGKDRKRIIERNVTKTVKLQGRRSILVELFLNFRRVIIPKDGFLHLTIEGDTNARIAVGKCGQTHFSFRRYNMNWERQRGRLVRKH